MLTFDFHSTMAFYSMLIFTLECIFIVNLSLMLYNSKQLGYLYIWCYLSSGLSLTNFIWTVLTFKQLPYYLLILIDELVFRLPLLYFSGDFSNWVSIAIFTLEYAFIHRVQTRRHRKWNRRGGQKFKIIGGVVMSLLYSFAFGFLITQCFLQYGFIMTLIPRFVNHLMVNGLCFPYNWIKHHPIIMTNYLNERAGLSSQQM